MQSSRLRKRRSCPNRHVALRTNSCPQLSGNVRTPSVDVLQDLLYATLHAGGFVCRGRFCSRSARWPTDADGRPLRWKWRDVTYTGRVLSLWWKLSDKWWDADSQRTAMASLHDEHGVVVGVSARPCRQPQVNDLGQIFSGRRFGEFEVEIDRVWVGKVRVSRQGRPPPIGNRWATSLETSSTRQVNSCIKSNALPPSRRLTAASSSSARYATSQNRASGPVPACVAILAAYSPPSGEFLTSSVR